VELQLLPVRRAEDLELLQEEGQFTQAPDKRHHPLDQVSRIDKDGIHPPFLLDHVQLKDEALVQRILGHEVVLLAIAFPREEDAELPVGTQLGEEVGEGGHRTTTLTGETRAAGS